MPKILKMTPYGFPERVSSSHLSDDLNQAYSLENFQIENYCPTPCRGISDEVRKKYKNINRFLKGILLLVLTNGCKK